MSLSVATFRPGQGTPPALSPAQAHERWLKRRVGIVWGLLVLDALTYYGSSLGIPNIAGKAITQGSLPLALLIALTVNRRLLIRPSVFLSIVSLLVLEALITTLQPQHLGTIYRTFRLAEFVATLWLLTPFWGRRDMLLVRCHLKTLAVLLGSVLLGTVVSPSYAFVEGRLTGAIWVIPATQVAHYAAILMGMVVLIWLCGELNGRTTLIVVAVASAILLLTHTRTALVGMVAGILVAGLSLIVARARVRKLFAIGGAVAAIAITTLSSVLTSYLARGEGTQQLTELTGRTVVWTALVNYPRDKFQEFLGFGLSNSSFNGLPIDSNWLASYQEQGFFGVAVCISMLVFLLVTAYFQPRGVRRALALFLVTYCLVSSFTEVGFTDASIYLLELTLAASLIVPQLGGGADTGAEL
jgi:hypothetical protein